MKIISSIQSQSLTPFNLDDLREDSPKVLDDYHQNGILYLRDFFTDETRIEVLNELQRAQYTFILNKLRPT